MLHVVGVPLTSVCCTCCRWEVYLCTTAEREYAWEAWRLLDPQATIFPHNQLSWRMLCVSAPQKKDLLNVLRKGTVDAAAARGDVPRCASDPQFVTDKGEGAVAVVGLTVTACIRVKWGDRVSDKTLTTYAQTRACATASVWLGLAAALLRWAEGADKLKC
jgi:hypothetical protein